MGGSELCGKTTRVRATTPQRKSKNGGLRFAAKNEKDCFGPKINKRSWKNAVSLDKNRSEHMKKSKEEVGWALGDVLTKESTLHTARGNERKPDFGRVGSIGWTEKGQGPTLDMLGLLTLAKAARGGGWLVPGLIRP